MWIPLRSAKMYSRIFGFHRRVWCPKWTPASSSCFMVVAAIWGKLLWFFLRSPRFPVIDPARIWLRAP